MIGATRQFAGSIAGRPRPHDNKRAADGELHPDR